MLSESFGAFEFALVFFAVFDAVACTRVIVSCNDPVDGVADLDAGAGVSDGGVADELGLSPGVMGGFEVGFDLVGRAMVVVRVGGIDLLKERRIKFRLYIRKR